MSNPTDDCAPDREDAPDSASAPAKPMRPKRPTRNTGRSMRKNLHTRTVNDPVQAKENLQENARHNHKPVPPNHTHNDQPNPNNHVTQEQPQRQQQDANDQPPIGSSTDSFTPPPFRLLSPFRVDLRGGNIGRLEAPSRLDSTAQLLTEATPADALSTGAPDTAVGSASAEPASEEPAKDVSEGAPLATGGSQKEPKSYLCFDICGTAAQRRLLDEKVAAASEAVRESYRGFVLHLYHTAEVYEPERYSPIHSDVLKTELPGAERLANDTSRLWNFPESVIECKDDGAYSYANEEAREYRLRIDFAMRLAAAGVEDRRQSPCGYNLLTGRRSRGSRPALRTRFRTPSGHLWGTSSAIDTKGIDAHSLLDGALRRLDEATHPINDERLDAVVAAHWPSGSDNPDQPFSPSSPGDPLDSAPLADDAQVGRRMALASSVRAVRGQITGRDGPVAYLKNAYEVQPLSGRVSFRRGGPQGLPRIAKAFAYDLDNVFNWDIKSCHTAAIRCLSADLRAAGCDVDTAPWDNYLARGGKDHVANTTIMPRALAKFVEHAVKYGAWLPATMKQAQSLEDPGRSSEVAGQVAARFPTREKQDKALAAIREVYGPLRSAVQELANGLLGAYWDAHKRRGGRGKGWTMVNACGVTFCPHDYPEGHVRRSKAMAWYLQGLEAAFVHAITLLQDDYGYEAFANEHDGCITLGAVPSEAVARARKLSGFEGAEFVQKPFADPKEVIAFCEQHSLAPPRAVRDQWNACRAERSPLPPKRPNPQWPE